MAGNADNDDLDGGDGADMVYFGQAVWSVTASLVAGTASGEGADTLTGIERLSGSPQADTLIGDAGANILLGLGGADTLAGGEGGDQLYGGDRDDPSLDGGEGNDLIDGGNGTDTCVNAETVLNCASRTTVDRRTAGLAKTSSARLAFQSSETIVPS